MFWSLGVLDELRLCSSFWRYTQGEVWTNLGVSLGVMDEVRLCSGLKGYG